jgi:hypothetical protein
MTTDIAIRNDSEPSPFKAFADETTANALAGDLLRFAKGNFVCGEEKKRVQLGTQFVANMDELWHGWQRWFNGKIVDHKISRVIDCAPRILRDELGNLDESLWETGPSGEVMDPWQQVQRLVMREANGKRLVTFSTSSWGGRVALGKLAADYDAERDDYPGAYPIVQLGVFMQRHKQYGEIPQPRFDIVGWTEGFSDGAAPAPRIKPDPDDPRTLIGQKIDDEIVVPGEW